MSWFAVYAKPNAELSAVTNLKRQGFDVYCPRFRKQRRHAGRVETVIRPLFPRYLFINMDMENCRWRAIHSTTGVSHLVCQGERPWPVADHLIDAIKATEVEGVIDDKASSPVIAAGTQVRISWGPLADQVGTLVQLSDHERVEILLELMQGTVKVSLPRAAVQACL